MPAKPFGLDRDRGLQDYTIEKAREQVAQPVGVHSDQVIISRYGSETNKLMLKSAADSSSHEYTRRTGLGAVRAGFGKDNTIADVERLIRTLREILDTTSKSAVTMAAKYKRQVK